MNQITNGMKSGINSLLDLAGSPLKIIYNEDFHGFQIVLVNSKDLKSYIVNPSDDVYNMIENFFEGENIQLRYNADRSIFWSK